MKLVHFVLYFFITFIAEVQSIVSGDLGAVVLLGYKSANRTSSNNDDLASRRIRAENVTFVAKNELQPGPPNISPSGKGAGKGGGQITSQTINLPPYMTQVMMASGRLGTFYSDRPDTTSLPGNVYSGKVCSRNSYSSEGLVQYNKLDWFENCQKQCFWMNFGAMLQHTQEDTTKTWWKSGGACAGISWEVSKQTGGTINCGRAWGGNRDCYGACHVFSPQDCSDVSALETPTDDTVNYFTTMNLQDHPTLMYPTFPRVSSVVCSRKPITAPTGECGDDHGDLCESRAKVNLSNGKWAPCTWFHGECREDDAEVSCE